MKTFQSLCLILIGIGLGIVIMTLVAVSGGIKDVYYLPPCPTEDSNNCIWDAATRGNHQGTSFITLDNKVYYYSFTAEGH